MNLMKNAVIRWGTKPQKAIMIFLFIMGIIAIIVTSIMSISISQSIDNHPNVDLPKTLLFYILVDSLFWVPFVILYKVWNLKWDWKRFIPKF